MQSNTECGGGRVCKREEREDKVGVGEEEEVAKEEPEWEEEGDEEGQREEAEEVEDTSLGRCIRISFPPSITLCSSLSTSPSSCPLICSLLCVTFSFSFSLNFSLSSFSCDSNDAELQDGIRGVTENRGKEETEDE
jgi:hypothetical protein